MFARWALGTLVLGALSGCGGESLEGFVWDVELVGRDAVTDDVYYQETLAYRLTFQGGAADLHIDGDLFASGELSGCEIEYESVIWGQDVDGFEVRWQLLGAAQIDYGTSGGCNEDGVDWAGTEIFVIESTGGHPDLEVGDEFDLEATGTYRGEL